MADIEFDHAAAKRMREALYEAQSMAGPLASKIRALKDELNGVWEHEDKAQVLALLEAYAIEYETTASDIESVIQILNEAESAVLQKENPAAMAKAKAARAQAAKNAEAMRAQAAKNAEYNRVARDILSLEILRER